VLEAVAVQTEVVRIDGADQRQDSADDVRVAGIERDPAPDFDSSRRLEFRNAESPPSHLAAQSVLRRRFGIAAAP